jgi:hypothetical protein
MKHLLMIAFLTGSSFFSQGQGSCRLSSLSKGSKDELQNFWTTLKESLQQKDTARLLSLCAFPFHVSQDIFSHSISDRGKTFTLDSNNIMKYADMLFFGNHFKDAISLYDDPTKCLILHGNYLNKHKTCGYIFCYSYDTEKGLREEKCYSIVKFGQKYKMDLHWISYE